MKELQIEILRLHYPACISATLSDTIGWRTPAPDSPLSALT